MFLNLEWSQECTEKVAINNIISLFDHFVYRDNLVCTLGVHSWEAPARAQVKVVRGRVVVHHLNVDACDSEREDTPLVGSPNEASAHSRYHIL